MERTISAIKQGDYVQFPHRKDSSLKLTGCVVNILTNTIVVDISEMILSEKYKDIDTRQVVKHGQYKKVRIRKNHAS
ncbi:DUF2187 family protein [Bacillus thuringiensis]|nr:DUF2187 family protein [Bacillus thuringiensis]MED2759351.1 DUF2187 family protein [Bacillus thuringiensis]MED2771508.1 DUF2187 family protein [Bacillus thuringiensis]MED2777640.1 DUF2187 family protein [Bacillus thuringiensis]MED2784277.1 DUF2187 family protein [Bacillus thuringiensis]